MLARAVKLSVLFSSLGLVACIGSDESFKLKNNNDAQGSINVAITDAAVDNATALYVMFDSIEIHSEGNDNVVVQFDPPKQINLLALQGAKHEDLLMGETLAVGEYQWMRLGVVTENELDTYLQIGDEVHELTIPSSAKSGLKLNRGFTVAAGSVVDFVIDFDLRKSVHRNHNGYMLRPTLRVVDNVDIGHIAGVVEGTLLSTECDEQTDYAVYAYNGAVTVADDIGSTNEPITTALITLDEGVYRYELGFLPTGTYTMALTCQAGDDLPDADDDVAFYIAGHASVEAGETEVFDFN